MLVPHWRGAKFRIVQAVRAAGLLKLADSCRFVLGQATAWSANRRFHRVHPGFATPPPHLAFDALNHVNWLNYRESGLRAADFFSRVIRDAIPGVAPLEILEWGCGPGRVIRHLPALFSDRCVHLTGSDYNAESILWCRRSLPSIEFVENGLNPPLSLPDSQFDVVYSFSVVTHLSEAVQRAWLHELHRVLRPGGLLVFTTHGDAYRYLLAAKGEQKAYDAGHLVVQSKYQEGKKWFMTLHPETFVRNQLMTAWNEVQRVAALPGDGILQDVWIARKPHQSSR